MNGENGNEKYGLRHTIAALGRSFAWAFHSFTTEHHSFMILTWESVGAQHSFALAPHSFTIAYHSFITATYKSDVTLHSFTTAPYL